MALINEVESNITKIQGHLDGWSTYPQDLIYKEWTLPILKQELTEALSLIKNEVTGNSSTLLLYELNQSLMSIFSYIPSAIADQGSFNNCVDQTYVIQKLLNQFAYKSSRLDAIIRRSLAERKTAADAFKNTIITSNEIEKLKAKILEEQQKIEEFYQKCFSDEYESVETRIIALENEIDNVITQGGILDSIRAAQTESQTLKKTIEEYHSELLVETETEHSIKSEITELIQNINKKKKIIEDFVNDYIIGYSSIITDDNGSQTEQIIASKKQLIDELHLSFEKFIANEKAQIITNKNEFNEYEKLKKSEIETLLKSATNASLASSFETLKKEIIIKRETAEKAFYLGLVLIVAGILLPYLNYIDGILFKPDQIYLNLLKRLSITAPFIWFAVYQSIKVSQYFRLEHEYAHKEVVSRSFEGYKSQVQELYKDNNASLQLLEKLLGSAISTISKNPASTLDKIKRNHLPSSEILEPIMDNAAGIANKVFGKPGK